MKLLKSMKTGNYYITTLLFFHLIMTFISSATLHAQNSYTGFNSIGYLPSNLVFADSDNDKIITKEEARKIFELYWQNPDRKLANDLVKDIESDLIDLIGYLENIDCEKIKGSPVSKKFIELYYSDKFNSAAALNQDPKNQKLVLDSLLAKNFEPKKQNTLAPNTFSLEIEKSTKDYLKADSAISELRVRLDKNVKVSGLIDTYYSYDLNNPSNGSLIGSTGAGRVFDRYHNKIMLSMAQTKFEYTTNGLRAMVDLAYGLGGEIANYGNTGTSLIIKQVYLSYDVFKNATMTVGNFATHVGYEVIESTNNFNYSVSNLFANGPFYHTGIKMDYSINKKLSAMGGVVSGWDKIQDDNKAKTLIGQFTIKPNSSSFLCLNWIGGNEAPSSVTGDTIKDYKQLFDITGAKVFKKKLTLGINAAFGINNYNHKKNTWGGSALYLNYKFNDKLAIGVRGEYFDDSQHVQYLGCSYIGETLTLVFTPLENISFKLEAKRDEASQAIYWKGKTNELSKQQTTFGMAIIGKF